MPTPIEILMDPISLIVIAMYLGLFLWESFFPGREMPKMKYWKIRGIGFFVFYFYLSSYLPLIWDKYLVQYQLMDMSHLGTLGGGLIGVLLYEFGVFAWHYSLHKSNFLWRVFHQMHHSAERIDIPSAFIFSPMDMIGWTFLGSLCFALIVGLSPAAITFMLLVTFFLGTFQHANINTPHWLGYLIQRPESHSIHHEKGVHAYNYSDLPIFDMIFGTFKNPKSYSEETGFYEGASYRLGEMLLFQDVSEPKKKVS